MTAVSWQDGCQSQLASLISAESMEIDEKLRIRRCKHSASRSGVEQSADVGPCFRTLKSKHRFADKNDLRRVPSRFERIIRAGMSFLHLEAFKMNSIVEFVGNLPSLLATTYASEAIKKGFLGNGQIDEKSHSVPDIYKLLGTYRGHWDVTEDDLKEMFDHFFEEMAAEGAIKEESFTAFGVPSDENSTGDLVERDHSLSSEHRQRAKVLSNLIQRQGRRDRFMGLRMDKYNKELASWMDEEKLYNRNKECQKKVLGKIGGGAQCLSDAREEHFGIKGVQGFPSVDELKAFIRVRSRTITNGGTVQYFLGGMKTRPQMVSKCVELQNIAVPGQYRSKPVLIDSN